MEKNNNAIDIIIALGSNLGNRLENLNFVLVHLRSQIEISAVSGIYETEPVGFLEQGNFFNMAVQGKTEFSPINLLTFVKNIEKQMGRAETLRDRPRLIDIDIIYYDDQILESDDLIIPHPRMHQRRFVLVPMLDLPNVQIHPVFQLTTEQLLANAQECDVQPVNFSY